MMCLLCEPEDDDALWLAAALQHRGEEVTCVLPQELMVGSSLSCRIDSTAVRSTLRLHDGRVLDTGLLRLVVNRLVDLPVPAPGAAPADRRYLAEEWRAATTAWLRTMPCPVLNPPRAAFLAGPLLPVPAWRAIGSACGFTTVAWQSDLPTDAADPVHVVCVAGRCVQPTGTVPPEVVSCLSTMAHHVGCPLLGATFHRADGRWALCAATPRPRLAAFGDALVDAVVALAHAAGDWP